MPDSKIKTTPPKVEIGPKGPRPPSLPGVVARRSPEAQKARAERQAARVKLNAERARRRAGKRAEKAATATKH